MEIVDLENVKKGEPYNLDLKRFGHRTEFRINGRKVPSRGKLSPFLTDTALFIGGLPPGVEANIKLGGAAPFDGCISKVCCHLQYVSYFGKSQEILSYFYMCSRRECARKVLFWTKNCKYLKATKIQAKRCEKSVKYSKRKQTVLIIDIKKIQINVDDKKIDNINRCIDKYRNN